MSLERQADAELHFAWVPGARDAAEARVPEDPVGEVEVHPVEQVERLPAEFELGPAERQRARAIAEAARASFVAAGATAQVAETDALLRGSP